MPLLLTMAPQASNMSNGSNRKSSSSAPPMRDFFFLNDDACHALPNYQYQGDDLSLLYKYVLSPLAAFFVNRCTPHTIAPNTITLIGLCFMVTSYLVEWYYSPLLEPNPEAPAWIFLLNAIAMLIYQTLDNMDGKQARRTGSSSPLGLLFDHGCDAANSMFGSANWIIAIDLSLTSSTSTQDVLMCWILVLGPMALFYVATWEEYYTGKLILPIMNGPNEGLVLGALTSLMTFLYGISYWQDTTWYDTVIHPYLIPILPTALQEMIPKDFYLRNCDVQVFMATFGFIQETFSKALLVSWRYGISSLQTLLPFVTLCVCTFVVGMYNPEIWIRMPRTTIHLISGLFVEMCAQLMLDHITAQKYNPYRWVLFPLVGLTIAIITSQVQASPWTDDFLIVYTSSLWTFLVLKMTLIVHEICTVLNIWCFDIVTPRHANPLYLQSTNTNKPKLT